MAMVEYLTDNGRELLSRMLAGKAKITFTKIEMGDGTLAAGQIRQTMTGLVNKIVELNVEEVSVSENRVVSIGGVFDNSSMTSGFYYREKGVYATDGTTEVLFAYANSGTTAEFINPPTVELVEKKIISLYTSLQDKTGTINITVASGIYASKVEMEQLKADMENISVYQKAAGSASDITLSGIKLEDGMSKTFIVTANNNGAATTINGKSLYKPGTTEAPKLIAGKAVTVWYDAAGSCFFIKASAEGTATADKVLAGETFSNNDDTGIPGTVPVHNTGSNTAATSRWSSKGRVSVVPPYGHYYNGGAIYTDDPAFDPANYPETVNMFGQQGSMPERTFAKDEGAYTNAIAAKTDGVGNLCARIPSGHYLDEVNGAGFGKVLLNDPNFIPANFLNTKTVFNMQGSIPVRTPHSQATQTYTAELHRLYLNVLAGYYDGSVWVYKDDANFDASKIPADLNIFGLQGTRPMNRYTSGTTQTGESNSSVYVKGLSDYNYSNVTAVWCYVANIGFTASIVKITWLWNNTYYYIILKPGDIVGLWTTNASDTSTFRLVTKPTMTQLFSGTSIDVPFINADGSLVKWEAWE